MLKIIKVRVSVELKADTSDEDDVRERLYETLQVALDNEELNYELEEDEEELELEE
jgi:hypothetical protein